MGVPRRTSKIYLSLLEGGYTDDVIPLWFLRPGREEELRAQRAQEAGREEEQRAQRAQEAGREEELRAQRAQDPGREEELRAQRAQEAPPDAQTARDLLIPREKPRKITGIWDGDSEHLEAPPGAERTTVTTSDQAGAGGSFTDQERAVLEPN